MGVHIPEGIVKGVSRALEALDEPGLWLPAVLLLANALPFCLLLGSEWLVDELVLILEGVLEAAFAELGLATTTGLPEASRLIS